jgi:hypothetical protein
MSDIIFIDDSGSKQWNTPYAQDFVDRPPVRNEANRNFWLKNYFVLAGVFVDSETISKLNPLINEAKVRTFGTKHVEIHSSDLRYPHQRRKKYLEPFGITSENLKCFIDDFWYPMIASAPQMKIQAVVLDKRYHKNHRDRSPVAITTQALLDRIELGPDRTSRIIFDQMEDGLKSEKGEQGEILKVANHEIELKHFFERYSHANIGFEKSSTSNFLQIADTVAYNILRQFVDNGDKWNKSEWRVGRYSYFDLVYPNFYCKRGSSCPEGSGLTKLPDEKGFRRRR